MTEQGNDGRRIPAWLFSVLGWGLIAVALGLAVVADKARREWIRVEGEIVGFTSHREDEGTRAPIVEYRSPEGERLRVEGEIASTPRAGKRGDRVPVLIKPDDPAEVRLGTPLELWLVPGIVGAIGLVLTLIGAHRGEKMSGDDI